MPRKENFGKLWEDPGHVRTQQHGRLEGPVAVCCCPPSTRDVCERAQLARPAVTELDVLSARLVTIARIYFYYNTAAGRVSRRAAGRFRRD